MLNTFFDILKPKSFSIVEGEPEGGTAVDDLPEDTPDDEPVEPAADEIVIDGKKYKKADLIGADGLPRGHNKVIELERKQKELEERINLGQGLQRPPPIQQVNHIDNIKKSASEVFKKRWPDKDAELIDAAVEIATEISAGFHQTGQAIRAPIDAAYLTDRAKAKVKEQKDKDALATWNDEIDEEIEKIPTDLKLNPQNAGTAVKNAIDIVRGRHVDEILADARKNANVRPRDTSAGGTPGSGSRETKPVTPSPNSGLNQAQLDDAAIKNLKPKDYGYLMAKQKQRDKDAGKPIRQLLGK